MSARSRWIYGLGSAGSAIAGVAIVVSPTAKALLLGSMALAVVFFLARRWPEIVLAVYLVLTLLQPALYERFPAEAYSQFIGSGFRLVDLVLVGMIVVTAYEWLNPGKSHSVRMPTKNAWLLLGAVLAWAILRGWSQFGVSSVGEFRYRYMSIGAALFCAAMGSRPEVLRRMVRATIIVVPVFLYLASIYSVIMTGIEFGSDNRVLHSAASLALLLCVCGCWLYAIRSPKAHSRLLLAVAVVPAAFLIVVDGHRSVWLAAGGLMVVLAATRTIRLRQWLIVLLVLTLVVGTVGLLWFGAEREGLDYVVSRGSVFVNAGGDSTALWRMAAWRATLWQYRNELVFGEGFGGYWKEVYVPEFDTNLTVYPHSLYVMTLAKLGVVGLVALIALGLSIAAQLVRARLGFARSGAPEDSWVGFYTVFGLCALISVFLYGIAYGIEPISWVIIGLCIAGIEQKGSSLPLGEPL